MNCPSCHKEIAREVSSCPACGFSFDEATQRLESNASPAPGSPPKQSHSSPSFGSIDDARFIPGAMIAERYRIVGMVGRGGATQRLDSDPRSSGYLWFLYQLGRSAVVWREGVGGLSKIQLDSRIS
jgi:hypothetical protein